MWVVVWSETDITEPFATKAQAQRYRDQVDPHGIGAQVVQLHRPEDPGYDRDIALHGILIRDD